MTAVPGKGLARGTKIGEGLNTDRWVVVKKLGEGGFAEVYEVMDTLNGKEKCAMKIDKARTDPRGGTIKMEYKVMTRLQQCPQVCRVLRDSCGTHEGRWYMIMELLGMNLVQMRQSSPQGRFQGDIVQIIGVQILDALEGIHKLGYIHRDVKPANFGVTPVYEGARNGKWRAFDLGIARKFTDDQGNTIPARDDFNEFRGSTTYASVHAHAKQDLGRRDDLWSWLYMVVEMLYGTLPWRGDKGAEGDGAREVVTRKKLRCLDYPDELTTSGPLPGGLVSISNYLRGMDFAAEPDYNQLRAWLSSIPLDTPALHSPRLPANAPVAHQAPPAHAVPMHAGGHAPAMPWDYMAGSQVVGWPGMTQHHQGAFGQQYMQHYSMYPVPQHHMYQQHQQHPPPQHPVALPVPSAAPPVIADTPASPSEENNGVAAIASKPPWVQNGTANGHVVPQAPADLEWEPGPELLDDDPSNGRSAKRAKGVAGAHFSSTFASPDRPPPGPAPSRSRGSMKARLAEISAIVGQVQIGKVSQNALDVKERLRGLDPVEGLGVIAWLLGRMEQNIKPEQLDQVARWMEDLAAYSEDRAQSCWAKFDAAQGKP